MIFATIDYKGEYDEQHKLLYKILAKHFDNVQAGLQSDSWIRIRKNDDEVTVDSFTSMKHEVKAIDRDSQLVHEVVEVQSSNSPSIAICANNGDVDTSKAVASRRIFVFILQNR